MARAITTQRRWHSFIFQFVTFIIATIPRISTQPTTYTVQEGRPQRMLSLSLSFSGHEIPEPVPESVERVHTQAKKRRVQ
uniref:Putative secreted protein n=1 Tax=Anopheles triannulatus TaxID=58253 RepID=A0A2M4B4N7_9DIPT